MEKVAVVTFRSGVKQTRRRDEISFYDAGIIVHVSSAPSKTVVVIVVTSSLKVRLSITLYPSLSDYIYVQI